MSNAVANGATGAGLFSSSSHKQESGLDACQTGSARSEPSVGQIIPETGAQISRRSFVNSLVSISVASATPVAAPTMPQSSDRRALEAYASWLHMELRLLCLELWPHLGSEAERYVWADNAGHHWHFRGEGSWRDLPQPSTRAAAVLNLVGVDWKDPRYGNVSPRDDGSRPSLPDGWPGTASGLQTADQRLLDLVEDFLAIQQRYFDACLALDKLSEREGPLPEVLRIQPRDLEFGMKLFQPSDEHWHRPCDITQWRDVDRWEIERQETADSLTITTRRIPASDELRSRAVEICAAYDAWYNQPRKRGFAKAAKAKERASRAYHRAEAAVCSERATTLSGLQAKLRCIEINGQLDDLNTPITESLLLDLQQMGKTISA